MNLNTLIEILSDYREEFGGDAEVRLMTQESWPFENQIRGLTSGREIIDSDDDDCQEVNEDRIVYLVEGDQIGYGSKRAWETCRDC